MSTSGQCATLGGATYDPMPGLFNNNDNNSFGGTGRHGSSNTWARWSGRSTANKGIQSRAPYGNAAASSKYKAQRLVSLGGVSSKRSTGLGLGPHGHGIGVVKSAIGGPHNSQSSPITVTMKQGVGKVATPVNRFCGKCFGTWLLVGAGVFALAAATASAR
jgi:hypothetical protein